MPYLYDFDTDQTCVECGDYSAVSMNVPILSFLYIGLPPQFFSSQHCLIDI